MSSMWVGSQAAKDPSWTSIGMPCYFRPFGHRSASTRRAPVKGGLRSPNFLLCVKSAELRSHPLQNRVDAWGHRTRVIACFDLHDFRTQSLSTGHDPSFAEALLHSHL